ncbi:hypothetical protein [Ilumatobacter sp.]|uniref:hypothetical protein n=1 Tax=Ilumatobacter sp. TaxID=1967498 RepID=UPI003753B4AA
MTTTWNLSHMGLQGWGRMVATTGGRGDLAGSWWTLGPHRPTPTDPSSPSNLRVAIASPTSTKSSSRLHSDDTGMPTGHVIVVDNDND